MAYKNEGLDAFEVGIKSDLLDRTLRLNASLFSYDYANLQIRKPVPTGGVNIENAAQAKVKGAEVELSWVPLEALTVNANIAWLDTELEDFITEEISEDDLFPLGSGAVINVVDASGNELGRAPKLQYYVDATYTKAIGSRFEGAVMLSYRHQDEVFFLETNQDSDTYSGEESDQFNVRFSLASLDGHWQVALFGTNITDERVVTQVASKGSYPNASLNPPKKWGLDFRYNF